MTLTLRMRSTLRSLLVLLFLLAHPSLAAAQGEATVAGTVRAQGGGPLAGVEVRFTPGEAGAATDARGRFVLRVPAGTAGEVVFRAERYETARLAVAATAAGGRREVAVTLAPSFTLDALSVVAERERPLLNTEDAAAGGAVERAELEALPSDARNPLALAFGIPGVAQSTGFFGDAPPLSIHGANSLYTQYAVDGLDNNEGFLGGPRVEFPLSGISRLSVLASTYSAEFGRSSNGVVDVETRAGGSRWGGEAFVFGRPGIPFDATPKFTPAGTDPEGFRRFQVGGAGGGPLVRDRTFVYGTVEYGNEREDRIGSTAQTRFVGTEVRETWKAYGRLDHGWSPSQTSTLRFAMSDVSRAGQGSGVVVPEADITTRRVGTITALTHRSALRGGEAGNVVQAQLGTFHWYFPPTESDLLTPQVTIVGPDRTTVQAVVGSSNFVFDERETQLQIRDVFQARLGAHTLRLGGEASRAWFTLDGSSTNPRGAYTVVNDGRITPSGRFVSIRDIPADVEVLRYTIDANPQEVDLSQTLLGAFVEDRWRVSPSLTLSLGVRWDYDDITSRGESEADLDNVQPRGSFNWLAGPATVVRGGAGIYTGKLPYAVYSDAVQFGPEGNAVVTYEGTFGGRPLVFGEGPRPEEIRVDPRSFPPREIRRTFARGLEQPESYQATLGVQRQLGTRWGVQVDGVWVRTRHLPRSWDLNAVTRPLMEADTVDRPAEFGDASRPVRPDSGSFRRLTTTDSGGNAEYVGLHTTVRFVPTRRSSLDATWVWSRARNDTEDINFNAARGNDFAAEWADGVNDRRHKVTVRGFHTLGERLRLGGVADWQTGTPVNRVAYFRDLDGSGVIFGNGFVGNHDRFPGVPRNGERLPSELRLDATAAYLLRVPRGGTVEARVDVFNVFNATIVSGFANGIPGGGPRTQVGRPGDPMVFGAAAPPRQVQVSGRWVF